MPGSSSKRTAGHFLFADRTDGNGWTGMYGLAMFASGNGDRRVLPSPDGRLRMVKELTKKASGKPGAHSIEKELPAGEVLKPLGKPHPFDVYVGGKVITLATLLRRSVAIRHQRMFGISMVESRAVLRIGASGPLSLDKLADHIAIGKSQTSRVVTALVERKLVQRERDPNHPRGVAITLSPEGRVIEKALIEAAVIRNQELTGGLDPAALDQMAEVLDIMAERARSLLQSDQIWAGRTDDDDNDDVLA